MQRPQVTRLSLVALGVATSLLLGIFVAPHTIPNSGAVTAVGVDVYWDSNCTNAVTSIDWGTIEPGGTRNYTIYIKTSDPLPVTLSIDYGNWNPANASSYIIPSWNCTNYNLDSGSVATALLSLAVSPYASGITDFDFDITIAGVEIQQPSTLQILTPKIMQDPAQTVYYVRTGNIYDDSALGFVYSKSAHVQNIITQWNSTCVNQTTGEPLFSGNMVTFGGRIANKVTRHYEDNNLAKIGYAENATHFMFRRTGTGSTVYAVAKSTYNPNAKDYLAVEAFKDGDRAVLILTGISSAVGTYASGICFADLVWPHIANFGEAYYIYCWEDLNGDGVQTSNEISLITSGN